METKTWSSSVSWVHDDVASAGTDGFISTELSTSLRPLIPPFALMSAMTDWYASGKLPSLIVTPRLFNAWKFTYGNPTAMVFAVTP